MHAIVEGRRLTSVMSFSFSPIPDCFAMLFMASFALSEKIAGTVMTYSIGVDLMKA